MDASGYRKFSQHHFPVSTKRNGNRKYKDKECVGEFGGIPKRASVYSGNHFSSSLHRGCQPNS